MIFLKSSSIYLSRITFLPLVYLVTSTMKEHIKFMIEQKFPFGDLSDHQSRQCAVNYLPKSDITSQVHTACEALCFPVFRIKYIYVLKELMF